MKEKFFFYQLVCLTSKSGVFHYFEFSLINQIYQYEFLIIHLYSIVVAVDDLIDVVEFVDQFELAFFVFAVDQDYLSDVVVDVIVDNMMLMLLNL